MYRHSHLNITGIPMALGAGFKLNKEKDISRSRHSLLPVDADESIHRKSAEADLMSPTDKSYEHHHPPSSWSSVLENWYSHSPAAGFNGAAASDLNLKTSHEVQRMGPYELLTKERMMGLYLAVFIHRDAKPLVQGRVTLLYLLKPSDGFGRYLQICGDHRAHRWPCGQ